MKRLLIYLFLLANVGITGCDKKLDLKNPQAIGADDAFSTGEKVKKVLIGNYADLGGASMFGGDVIWMSELLGSDGDLNWVGTYPDPRQIWGKTIQTGNANVSTTYSQAYKVIYNSNNIIANIAVVDAAEQAQVTAEAKFLRAMAYFELIKFYGEKPYFAGNPAALKGVPLNTTAGPSAPQDEFYQMPRASVEAVYQQIVADFKDAETNLPSENGVYANKSSASLALARVYLQQDKFAEARDAANRCIIDATAHGFGLVMSSYEDAFNNSENTTEDLFAMQVTDQAGTNSCFTFFSTASYGARDGDIEVTPAHLAKYDAADDRLAFFFLENGTFHTGKWRDVYKNVKVMRLAEAYLIRAETNVRLNTAIGASPEADVNMTRVRAGLLPLTAPITLPDVLLERELELAFEGQGAWDGKRLRSTIDGKPWDDPKLTFPIPLRERNVNPGLEQNPGY